MNSIKDLIYFDIEKARSLISQLKGGLISEISRAFEDESEINSGIGFDVKIVKGNVGGKDKERHIKTEKVEIFHELLNEIEKELTDHGLLTNINETFNNFKGSFDDFISNTPQFSYIKANGWSQFEDFERFKKIFSNFNEVQRLIYTSSLLEDPQIKTLQSQIKEAKKNANTLERNQRAKALNKLNTLEKQFDNQLQALTEIHVFDEEYIRRQKLFLDTFTPKRLNFRLAPLDDFNEFQILATLKEKYLVDSNIDTIIYTYGSRPNVKLTVFGVITSNPRKVDERIDLNEEYLSYQDEELYETQGLDKAFRNVFKSFEAFEKFFFVPSYPKIAISPIAIFREIVIEKK